MRKYFSLLLTLIVIPFLMTSCGGDDPDPNPDPNPQVKTAEKTIFMYFPWSGSSVNTYTGTLYDEFLQNISDVEYAIKSQGGLGDRHLMAFICKGPRMTVATNQNKPIAYLIDFTYEKNAIVRDTIQSYTTATIPDYTTAAGLTTIWNQVKKNAPAKTYAMIIGSHGSGWLPKGVNPSVSSSKPRRAIGGTTAEYQLNIPDLASAISDAGIHLQYILLDDCYLSNIETAYELKDVADYMIASTSQVMGSGFPYARIWRYLNAKTPDYQSIVDNFYDYYSSYTWNGMLYPYGTIGITDLSIVSTVVALMKQINQKFGFDASKMSEVQRLDGYRYPVFFDMEDYVEHLCTDASLLAQIQRAINDLVPYKKATQQIYSPNEYYITTDVNRFCGMTISDPTQNSIAKDYVQKTSWWTATHGVSQ